MTPTDAQRRRIAVGRFTGERGRALADSPSALRRARLNFEGAGMSTAALVALSGISRETLRKAEADPSSVSAATLRRLASALGVPTATVLP
jgi:hypothetical protein